jgi:hypothetical protein
MSVVDTRTGEITEPGTALAPIDNTASAVAVTDYLTKARDWLSTAVEKSTPLGIVGAKVEIAVAAEATKQLGLSKEIQDEAAEMVRRAEYTLRKATKKAQAAGEMRSRESNLIPNARTRSGESSTTSDLPRPRDMFASEVEYRDALAMGDLDEPEFEEVLAEAKAEGNLSRANVARKAREKSGKTTPRKPLTDSARNAGWDLRKAVERLERIAVDDRFAANAEQVTPLLRSHLQHAVEVCQDLLDRLND